MLTTTLIFDPKTLARWKAEGISDVIVSFEKKGCEGNEIAVTPGKPIESQNSKTQFQSRTIPLESRTSQSADLTNSDLTTHETTITTHTLPQDSDLTIHALPEDWEKLENSRITFANGKWIFTSDQVKRRCGCGSSFSFSDENILLRDFPQIPTLPSAVSFELLENLSSKSLSQNTHILIDFGTKETEEIHIQSGANVLYRGFFPTGNHSIIRFILEEGAKLDARFLVFASKGHAKFDLETTLQGSRANAEIVYRAFAFEDAEIQANTHLDIRA